jgi:hypothetical protein
VSRPEYPGSPRCATCGHADLRHVDRYGGEVAECLGCRQGQKRHAFTAARLAGGALTPAEERAAYEAAMSESNKH